MTSTVSSDVLGAELSPPAGFVERRVWGGRLWVRSGLESSLPLDGVSLHDGFRLASGARTFAGRGPCFSIPCGPGSRAVLRHYHHGGMLAPLTGDLFWGPMPRPLSELRVSEELRSRGILTPEVLAIHWRHRPILFYQADIVTREVSGGVDLAGFLSETRGTPDRQRQRRSVLTAVGQAVLQLHEAGLDHPDLNLKNLLVRFEGRRIEVWVLDLDRARVVYPLPEPYRLGQLRRLERSLEKLSRDGSLAGPRDRLLFLRGYWKGHIREFLDLWGGR